MTFHFGSVWLHVHCLPPQPNFPNVKYSLLYSFLSLALHWSSQELCRVLLSPTGPLNVNYNRNLKSHSVTFERFPATFLNDRGLSVHGRIWHTEYLGLSYSLS